MRRPMLSAKRAMLVAMLIDAAIDSRFAASAHANRRLAFPAGRSPLAPLRSVTSWRSRRCAPWAAVVTEAVEVPIADYASLSTPDFMVSLYNDHTVQRVLAFERTERAR